MTPETRDDLEYHLHKKHSRQLSVLRKMRPEILLANHATEHYLGGAFHLHGDNAVNFFPSTAAPDDHLPSGVGWPSPAAASADLEVGCPGE